MNRRTGSALVAPSVLVISHEPIDTKTATGITLSNLFAAWPEARISQLFLSHGEPEGSIVQSVHRLPPTTAPFDYALRRLLNRNGRSIVRGSADGAAIPQFSANARRRHSLHADMRAIADISPMYLDSGTRSWLKAIAPDVVYSPLGNVRMARVAVRVARYTRCSVVPHFLDDWPSTLYTSNELLGFARPFVKSAIRQVMKNAYAGLAISPEMAREYQSRYSKPFVDAMNCVELGSAPTMAERSDGRKRSKTVRFVYVGGLHLGRDMALAEVAQAIDTVSRSGLDVSLTVVGDGGNLRSLTKDLPITYVGRLSSSEVQEWTNGADVLVHVESMRAEYRAFTRLSISTKIPQYLAAGRPILAYGPAEIASIAHLKRSGAAAVVTSASRDVLDDTVRELASGFSLRAQLGTAGASFARANHSAEVVRSRLRSVLVASMIGSSIQPEDRSTEVA